MTVEQVLLECTSTGQKRAHLSDLDALMVARVDHWNKSTPGSRKKQLKLYLIRLGWVETWTTVGGRNTRVWRSP